MSALAISDNSVIQDKSTTQPPVKTKLVRR